MAKTNQDKQFSMRLPQDLYAAAEVVAAAEHRTVSEYLRELIRDAVAKFERKAGRQNVKS